jgi:hypothetical protein
MKNHQSRPLALVNFLKQMRQHSLKRMQHHLKKIMVEDVIAAPEEVVDVVTITFGDVKVIISNQMTTMRGDIKKKIIHHLLKSLKVIVIDVV